MQTRKVQRHTIRVWMDDGLGRLGLAIAMAQVDSGSCPCGLLIAMVQVDSGS